MEEILTSRKLDTRLNPFQSGGYTSDLMKQFHDYKRQIYQDKQYEDEAAVHRMITYKLPSILFYIVIIRKLTLSRILKRLMQNLEYIQEEIWDYLIKWKSY